MSHAIHNVNPAFNDSAIAQYMNTDFIVLDISLCVALAREQFFQKLKDDDIPSHIFIEDNGRLAGLIAVRKLLQATDTLQHVMSGDGVALYNVADFTHFANMSLKFEMYVP